MTLLQSIGIGNVFRPLVQVLIPFFRALVRPMDAIHIAADGGPHHKGDMNRKLVEEHGYHELSWPP